MTMTDVIRTDEEIAVEAEALAGPLPAVLECPTEEECYLYAILTDRSGLDLAEFCVEEPENDDGCFRAWPMQWSWFRDQSPLSIDQCGRGVGKSLSIRLRAFAFPFNFPGQEMLITAPELNHLELVTEKVEAMFFATRLGYELMERRRGGITHRPFHLKLANGAAIIGRIPQRDGRGVKGSHPLVLDLDEAQDYPKQGWKELTHTLKRGVDGTQWKAHGVSRGVQDEFYTRTQDIPNNPWKVHRISQVHRPNWSDEEREHQIAEAGGSREDPDYKRNVYGVHGGAVNMLFVLHRLMRCHPAGTLVWTIQDGQKVARSIETIRIGTDVPTALGTGRVTAVHESEHKRLVRIRFTGGEHVCTPEHPILTLGGWVPAGTLANGDALLRLEDMPGVREAAASEGAEVLRSSMLEDRRDQTGQAVSRMWDELPWAYTEDRLLPGMQGNRTACREPEESGSVQLLRRADSHGNVLPQVLLKRMRRRIQTSPAHGVPVRGVRGDREFREAAALLLENLRWEGSGSSGCRPTHDEKLQGLRILPSPVLPTKQRNAVLLSTLRESGHSSTADPSRGSVLPDLQQIVPPRSHDAGLLFQGLLGRRADQATAAEDGQPHASSSAWRSSRTAVPPLAGSRRLRGRLASSVLGFSLRGLGRRMHLLPLGYCRHWAQVGSRSRRQEPSVGQDPRLGLTARCLAGIPRVDSVEVLERGDPEFDRLSGGEDQVLCYDLTISGHPSYAVGPDALLVHNCVDKEPESEYNDNEYYHVTIKDIDVEEANTDAVDLIDLPALHLSKYKTFWIGMDVGFLNDPSEIVVFAEYRPTAAERKLDEKFERAHPQEGATRVKLLTRISLIRMASPQQVKVILGVIDHYKPQVFAMDSTGNGLPLFQDVQALIEAADDPVMKAAARRVAETIKGYNFKEKILVAIDETVEVQTKPSLESPDPMQVAKDAGIEREVLEHSTDCLRKFVDEGRLYLPWDRELIGEFQGQTFSYSKSQMDPYGRRRRVYSEGKFHCLDGCRMAIMGLVQHSIEEFVGRKKQQRPVLDSFLD